VAAVWLEEEETGHHGQAVEKVAETHHVSVSTVNQAYTRHRSIFESNDN
jgi:hypothetical protein